MAIDEEKLCSTAVQIAVNIVLLGNRRQSAIVEQLDNLCRITYRHHGNLMIFITGSVDMFIQAVMEQIGCRIAGMTTTGIGRANPN